MSKNIHPAQRAEQYLSRGEDFVKKQLETVPSTDAIAERYANKTQPVRSQRILSGLAPYNGVWTRQEVLHLLRRTTYGVKLSQVEALLALSPTEAIDSLLNTTANPLPHPVNDYNNLAQEADPDLAWGAVWDGLPYSQTHDFWRGESVRKWWFTQMWNDDTILTRLMAFWQNHLVVQLGMVNAQQKYDYLRLIRNHSLGNFKVLVREMTTNAGMLLFLNGYLNEKSAPDENYARELMELFTLGKGADSGYTEADVQAAARILTGWRISWDDPSYASSYFEPWFHDTQDKTFSAFFGNRTIAGRTGTDGALETDDLINMIFEQPEVAKFVCRELYRWFIYYVIDEDTELNVITPLAAIFRDNNYEIMPVLHALFKSEHFFDVLNRGCFIKTPVDLVFGVHRSFGFTLPNDLAVTSEYKQLMRWVLNDMGMPIGDPPNVAGLLAFRQSPQYYEVWINSAMLFLRNIFTDIVSAWGGYYFEDASQHYPLDLLSFTATIPNAQDPNSLIAFVSELLLPMPLSTATNAHLKNILLYNQVSDYYWTETWNNYLNNPTNTVLADTANQRLKSFYKYILELPEFQLA